MKRKIGINGFGRIGRGFLRALARDADPLDVVQVNDLTDPATLAHLLKYDSVHGRYPGDVGVSDSSLVVDGDRFTVSAESDPANIGWEEVGAEIVVEATGRFRTRDGAAKHLGGSVKKVIISAPAPEADITLAPGVNLDQYEPSEHRILSNASCTTNCLAVVAKVLHETFKIESGLMTTIHSYTNDQRTLDAPHKDLRRARAAALSMIPTSTGAAVALKEVIPGLAGVLDGMAIRVPTPDVSILDLTCRVARSASVDDVNEAFTQAAATTLAGLLGVSSEPLVSVDYIGDTHSAVVDLAVTKVQGDLIKVIAWYDNEAGYAQRLYDLTKFVAQRLID